MQIEEAIEEIKLSKSTFLFGREQTIVNIEAIDTVLNELEEIDKAMTLQDKITRLMIKDFQTEGYFNYMKYEQIIEYYKRRKDLKE